MKESHMRTKLAHTGDLELAKKIQSSVSVPKVLPIYMSSVFTFDDVPSLDAVYAGEADGYVYSRMTNPSTDAAEEMLAAAEGADGALVFSSGMAAIINAIIANVQAGDHIVSSPVLYGGVYDYFKHELPRFGVEVTFVEFDDPAKVEAAIRPNTKVVYTETISNPLMEVNDLPAIAGIAHAHGCKLVVDNTFATAAVAIVLLREFAVSGMRLVAVEQGRVIAAAWSGKVKTASTMVCLCAMLLNVFGAYAWFDPLCNAVIVLTTAYSGIEYFIKNADVFREPD